MDNALLKSSKGFTLIELLVVISMMLIISTLVIVNYGRERSTRNVNIAQSQLVTNIRKVQSYALASRTVANARPVQYYVIKFDTASPTQYTIQAMYDVETSPQLIDVETVRLPPGVRFASSNAVTVRRPVSPTTQDASCGLVAFKLPFARILTDATCNRSGWNPGTDDYQKIINYAANADLLPVTSDSTLTVTLMDTTGEYTRSVLINGIIGTVCPTQNGFTCL